MPVIGNKDGQVIFSPGIYDNATFPPVRFVRRHPFLDKYYFIADSYGVRVLCMLVILLLFLII